MAWETSSSDGDPRRTDSSRQLCVQVRDRTTGAAVGDVLPVDVRANQYQDFRSFPDGSVAFPAPGSSSTRIKILRILPCTG